MNTKGEHQCSFCGVYKREKIIVNEEKGVAVCFSCLPFITKIKDEKLTEDMAASFRPDPFIRGD